MKKNVLITLCCISILLAANVPSGAQTLIHYWHFNNYSQGAMYTPTISAIPADYTDLAGSNARILYKSNTGTTPTTYIDSLQPAAADSDIYNARMGQPSGGAIRARNPSDSMKLYFYIPTTNFKNIVLKYATELSSTTHGMRQQVFDYSTDGGTSWLTTGLSEPFDSAATAFKLVTVSFTNTAVNNNANMVFRITFVGNDTGTSGNYRFDNVTLEGDTINTAAGVNPLSLSAANYTLFPNPVNNSLEITSATEGLKSVIITNAAGQNVYKGTQTEKNFIINTTTLSAGIYFINIHENTTGEENTLKFIKQ